jgi:flagellar basal body-associated protein FliL
MKPTNPLTKLLITVLGLVTLFVSNAVLAQSGGQVVYLDPFSFWMLVLGIVVMVLVVIGISVYIFTNINDMRNNTALTNAQINSINTNTNAFAQLVTALVNAIGVNTAITQREAEHRMNVENRYLDIYDKLVNNTIFFQNTLLNYYGQQLVTQDIRQLMSDRVKASVIQSTRPPTVESYQLQGEVFPPFPMPQGGGQNQQQGSSSTK